MRHTNSNQKPSKEQKKKKQKKHKEGADTDKGESSGCLVRDTAGKTRGLKWAGLKPGGEQQWSYSSDCATVWTKEQTNGQVSRACTARKQNYQVCLLPSLTT